MDKHVTFEELQKFIYAEAVTPDIIQLGRRINAHVMSCEECAEQYNAMLEMQQISEEVYREKVDVVLKAETGIALQTERDLIEHQMDCPEDSSADAGQEQSRGRSRGITH